MEESNIKLSPVVKVILAILIIVIAILALYIVFHKTSTTDRKLLESEIKRLQVQSDSLIQRRIQLDAIESKIDKSIYRLNSLDSALSIQQNSYNEKIKIVQKQYEKTNRIDTFSANSIKQYFADQFGH